MDPPAARVLRGGTVESVHRASIAVVDPSGRLVASFGDPRLVTFARSNIKHLQALPLLESGAADAFRLGERELAICASSHNGEPRHVRLVGSVLRKAKVSRRALQCGRHAPYDPVTAQRLGRRFTVLHHNCSGKHSGMLATCARQGWPLGSYLSPQHPLQRRIRGIIEEECGTRRLRVGTDGCSAPNYALALESMARAFARLMDAEGVGGRRGENLARLRDAMIQNPYVVGGRGRTDTLLMQAAPGRLWIKAGGEACYGLGLPGRRLGVAVKVEDGSSRPVASILGRVLEELDALPDSDLRRVHGIADVPLKNAAGKIVGQIEASFRLRWA